MTGRVLVEERVLEDEPGLLDRGGPVDERDLAEVAGLLVARELTARSTSSPDEAPTSTTRPPSKRSSRSRTIVPPTASGSVERTTPSVRRQSGVVKTSSVGRFGMMLEPVAPV